MKFTARLIVAALAIAAGTASPIRAAELVGVDFFGMLYDISESGGVSNPRSTGIDTLSGIAFGPDGLLYGHDAATDFLWRIDVATGASAPIGFIELDVTEGDLGFNPLTGVLYGVQTFGDDRLFTLDTTTGVGTPIGTIIADGDISAMAFDDAGNLFVLDTRNDLIYQVDPTNAAILNTLSIGGTNLGPAAGMVYNPDTGFFFIADGGPAGSDQFYIYAPGPQVLFPLANLPLSDGLSGLAYVPEPSSLLLLIGGAAVVAMRRRRASR